MGTSTPTPTTPAPQWWYEHLEAFPDTFLLDGTNADDDRREQGLLDWLLGEIDRLLPSVHAAVYMVQPESLDLHFQTVNDPGWGDELRRVGAEQIRTGLFAWTFKSGCPAIVESNGATRPHHIVIVPLMTPRSIIGACLILRDGSLGDFSLEQLKILSVLGTQFAAQTENQRLFRKLEDQNRTLETQVRQRTGKLETTLRSLEQMNLAVLEASRVKSRFLANTSHELRTPLNSILGFLHLLNDGLYAGEAEHAEFIKYALDSGRHLLALINDLLDLAKIESGNMAVKIEDVPFTRILHDVRAVMEVQAQQKHLPLTFDLRVPPALTVKADSRRLTQVLINLVGNAIKFTAEGSVRVGAEIDPLDSGMAQITISDTGIGIAGKTLERLGQPFVQGEVEQTERFGGTGLGLAISRAFVELMGGTLTLASAGEGRGTTVSVRLQQTADTDAVGSCVSPACEATRAKV